MKLEAKGIEGCAAEEYADWIELHTRREERWFEILGFLLRDEEPADLVAVMFDGPDKLQHLCWRYVDPAFQPAEPSPWEAEITALCEQYFRKLDAIVRDIVELAGPDPTVVLASDHGFGPSWDVFYLNAWLAQQGYLAWADDAAPDGAGDQPLVGFGQIARHVYELDWSRTVAYAGTPSSQGIHIVRQAPGAEAPMSAETYDRLTAEIADGLLQVTHPATGRPLVTEVVMRKDTFAGPYEELAPDVSIVLEGGAAVSILRSEALVRTHDEVKGNHRPEGVFLACGPSVKSGASVAELSIVDVAPLILYSLDVPVPDDMTGRIPGEVFEAGELERRQPRYVAARVPDESPELDEDELVVDSEDQVTIMNRLRALGYVE
jgi:predicted AlkP superfamily phosphohydrolase/phosphomutase